VTGRYEEEGLGRERGEGYELAWILDFFSIKCVSFGDGELVTVG